MSRYVLDEEYLPKKWYNVIPDLPEKIPPPLNPATREPIKPHELEPVFPKALIKQEMSEDRWIRIPEEVLDIYRIYRPTPLIRAERLEKALKTPAKIFYKYEGVSPPGSHKPNTAIAQA
ncbi:MAG: TrpB-like pyridoxal-phosphate dependent enzyme, partial [Archaeoglobaceae archaeon]